MNNFTKAVMIGLIGAGIASLALSAKAEVVPIPSECLPRAEWIAHMGQYGENVILSGIAGKDRDVVMEVWANRETGSWTVMYTMVLPDGKSFSCSSISGWDIKDRGK